MKKLKVMTVVGTRPEIIRLSRVITALENSNAIEHVLVHTGQNYDYELNQIFFDDLGIKKPDYFLEAAGKNASETIGLVIIKMDELLDKELPDAFLILGDTNSALSAIPAKKKKIPIFHMEAGNRCFDQRVPEEINRKIIDHIADVNLPYSSIAREYLLREGLLPDRIIKTGSPMFEVLHHYMASIKNSTILEKLNLTKNNFFVVSAHREENVSSPEKLKMLLDGLNSIAEKFQYPIIVSTHPRTKKMLDGITDMTLNALIRFIKPLGFYDFNALQLNAKVTLSDSGTISEESSILNFRAINIREAHERPEAMEQAAVMMTGFNIERILQAISELDEQQIGEERNIMLVEDYAMPNVSSKIVRIILSYTDYIKHNVWKN
jgi:UDP-N-acetyl-L-fucosamine synthase